MSIWSHECGRSYLTVDFRRANRASCEFVCAPVTSLIWIRSARHLCTYFYPWVCNCTVCKTSASLYPCLYLYWHSLTSIFISLSLEILNWEGENFNIQQQRTMQKRWLYQSADNFVLCKNLLLKRQMCLKGKARNDILIDNSSWEKER